jgi:hypothetical protein
MKWNAKIWSRPDWDWLCCFKMEYADVIWGVQILNEMERKGMTLKLRACHSFDGNLTIIRIF